MVDCHERNEWQNVYSLVFLCAAEESEEEGFTAVVDYESWQHARGSLHNLLTCT